MYLATLSDLEGAPVFICPTPIPTDKSAINASSVSPDLWEIIFLKLFSSDSFQPYEYPKEGIIISPSLICNVIDPKIVWK